MSNLLYTIGRFIFWFFGLFTSTIVLVGGFFSIAHVSIEVSPWFILLMGPYLAFAWVIKRGLDEIDDFHIPLER
jgi:hypothetical protein